MKIFSAILLTLLAANLSYGQYIELKLGKAGVSGDTTSRPAGSNGYAQSNVQTKTYTKSKEILLKITSRKPMKLLVFFWVTSEGRQEYETYFEEVSSTKPIEKSVVKSASRSVSQTFHTTKYTTDRGGSFSVTSTDGRKSRSGNDRIDACVFVFDAETGKLIGSKYLMQKSFFETIKKDNFANMEAETKRIIEETKKSSTQKEDWQ